MFNIATGKCGQSLMVASRESHLVPKAIGVKSVRTGELFANPHNPRMLFDRSPMDVLKGSIKKVGILVPLTVYWEESKKRFVILDGQRRWMCAKEIGLNEVPVNQVSEPTLLQNIVTMFQIHKLREDWELMPTALKLEVLMNQLKETSDRKLAELTRLDQAVVARCKKLLSYSRKYQDMMLHPDPEKRVKADFFIELYAVRHDRNVNKMAWFSKDGFTKTMLDKYTHKKSGLKAVTDFRIMKQHITNAFKAGKTREITGRLKDFSESDDLTLDSLVIHGAHVSARARSLHQLAKKLEENLSVINAQDFYGEDALWTLLERLMKLIKRKLSEAERRVD